MLQNDSIILIGYSGHGYVACDIFLKNEINILGYCDNSEKKENPFGLTYLGSENLYDFEDNEVFIAIGDNVLRSKIFNSIDGKATYGDAYHPTATIGFMAHLGTMNLLGANTVINPLSKIGDGVIINTGAIVEHDCTIGNFVHIAPGAVLAGNVSVGDFTFIGARAVVKQGVNICNNVVIGAGAVVVKSITEPGTYIGIPAQKI